MYKPIMLLAFYAFGVVPQSILNKAESKVSILGTSTLHDWQMTSSEFYGVGSLTFSEGIFRVNNYKIYFPVKKLASGKRMMDGFTQDALKEETNPNIIFSLISVTGTGSDAKAIGNLNIAGFTKNVQIPVKIESTSVSNKVTGSTKIIMSQYGVEPPKVIFGTIECGDEVTIEFQLNFNIK